MLLTGVRSVSLGRRCEEAVLVFREAPDFEATR